MLLVQILLIGLLFTLVVGIHELGHFLFAKWRGMEVEEFAIGFGPKVVSRVAKSGTTFSFRAIPLGGFVRIKGMEPKADASETQVAGGFYSRSLGSRALVLFAGPLFSILGGIVFFFANYAAYGEDVPTTEPEIGQVLRGGVADKAGLRKGDIVLLANGVTISTFDQFRKSITTNANKPLNLTIRRGVETLNVSMTPKLKDDVAVVSETGEVKKDAYGKKVTAPQGAIDIVGKTRLQRVSIATAATYALRDTWTIISETGRILATPSELKENAGGVIAIASATSRAAEEGLQRFISLAAIISISLGLINLLPIPLMDGGQLVVTFVEWLRGGRRLSLRTQEAIGFVGLVIIGLLFLSVTYLDIGRLLGN